MISIDVKKNIFLLFWELVVVSDSFRWQQKFILYFILFYSQCTNSAFLLHFIPHYISLWRFSFSMKMANLNIHTNEMHSERREREKMSNDESMTIVKQKMFFFVYVFFLLRVDCISHRETCWTWLKNILEFFSTACAEKKSPQEFLTKSNGFTWFTLHLDLLNLVKFGMFCS